MSNHRNIRIYRVLSICICICLCACFLFGCGRISSTNEATETGREKIKHIIDGHAVDSFVDARGNSHTYEINESWKLNDYDKSSFLLSDGKMTYTDGKNYEYRNGIDVSKFQGDIDWSKVKADGYDFCFVRIGYRGYGKEGVIKEDDCGIKNIKAALEVGFDVGVYFFSQAINEEEAIEEADFVLKLLKENGITPEKLQLPIVFDPESISDDEARTDNVTGEQFTNNTIAFIERVKAEGYSGMIYCNMLWEVNELDLSKLSDYPLWYADYEEKPQSPYAFEYWQYSDTATIDGVDGIVDVNIQLIKK